jgi:hypothetical protein
LPANEVNRGFRHVAPLTPPVARFAAFAPLTPTRDGYPSFLVTGHVKAFQGYGNRQLPT